MQASPPVVILVPSRAILGLVVRPTRTHAALSRRLQWRRTKLIAASHPALSREVRHPSRQIASFPGQPVPAKEPHPCRFSITCSA
jgi:hypothetical protein